jgi:hypothetical protein
VGVLYIPLKEVIVQILSTICTQRNIRNKIQNKSNINNIKLPKVSHHYHPRQPPTKGREETSYERVPQEIPLNQNLTRHHILTSPYCTKTREIAPPTRRRSMGY